MIQGDDIIERNTKADKTEVDLFFCKELYIHIF